MGDLLVDLLYQITSEKENVVQRVLGVPDNNTIEYDSITAVSLFEAKGDARPGA
jgi:hypothetical protein